jgi:hypothetical protein
MILAREKIAMQGGIFGESHNYFSDNSKPMIEFGPRWGFREIQRPPCRWIRLPMAALPECSLG